MPYNPPIKNVPILINELIELSEGKLSSKELLRRLNYRDYKLDCYDGFEEIIDAVSPFISQIVQYEDFLQRDLFVSRIKELIEKLNSGAPIEDLDEISLKLEQTKPRRFDGTVMMMFWTLILVLLSFVFGRFQELFN